MPGVPTTTTCRSCRAGMREADRFCWTCGVPRDAAATERLEVVHERPAVTPLARTAPAARRAPKPARTPHPGKNSTAPAATTSAAGTSTRPSRGQSGRVIAAFTVVLVGAVGTAAWWLLREDEPVRTTTSTTPSPASTPSEPAAEPSASAPAPEPTPSETAPAVQYPTGVLAPSRATAPSTSADSADAAGRTTSYEAANVLDANPSTAWRTEGSAAGSTLTFAFDSPVRITEVGLVNGFAKVDPADGTDRYPQGRRITAVTWTFQTPTGPVSVPQTLSDGVRDLQKFTVAPVETTSVELTIDAVTSPGAGGRFDRTAISDVQFANS